MGKYRCATCGFELHHPIATLSVSAVGLYDDARFPGRCILALREHEEHLDKVAPELSDRLMADIRTAMRAIRRATGAPRLNVAILGNVEPHIHAHLVPRGGPSDDAPRRTPWGQPSPARPLDPGEIEALVRGIREGL